MTSRTKLPELANGPPERPRTSISVMRFGGGLSIGFNGECSGRAEIVTVAEAEVLAERLLDWVDVIRFEELARRPQ